MKPFEETLRSAISDQLEASQPGQHDIYDVEHAYSYLVSTLAGIAVGKADQLLRSHAAHEHKLNALLIRLENAERSILSAV